MRTISTKATVLRLQVRGESNYIATILTPEGISSATLYGGAKSRLRSLVSPMNSGTMYMTSDEARHSAKINDFDVKSYHPSFRENLFKMLASSFATELLMKTHCAGSPGDAWILFNGFLDGMEFFDEREARIGLVRFMWRYIDILGVRPDTSYCAACGEEFSSGDGKNASHALSYSVISNGFICRGCAEGGSIPQSDSALPVSGMTLRYLDSVARLSPREARALREPEEVYREAQDLCIAILESVCGTSFTTLRTCAGIF